jgi:hypothetical protein
MQLLLRESFWSIKNNIFSFAHDKYEPLEAYILRNIMNMFSDFYELYM